MVAHLVAQLMGVVAEPAVPLPGALLTEGHERDAERIGREDTVFRDPVSESGLTSSKRAGMRPKLTSMRWTCPRRPS